MSIISLLNQKSGPRISIVSFIITAALVIYQVAFWGYVGSILSSGDKEVQTVVEVRDVVQETCVTQEVVTPTSEPTQIFVTPSEMEEKGGGSEPLYPIKTVEPTNTPMSTVTPYPTVTPRPTQVPTRIPTLVPTAIPTQIPLPTQVPTQVPQPTSVPATFECSRNVYNCSDFSTCSEAENVFNYCMSMGAGDIHDLDRDNDGPCDNLCNR